MEGEVWNVDYNTKIKAAIEAEFVHKVNPTSFMLQAGPLFTSYERAQIKTRSDKWSLIDGSTLLLERLVTKGDWFKVTTSILRHDNLKCSDLADTLETLKANTDASIGCATSRIDYPSESTLRLVRDEWSLLKTQLGTVQAKQHETEKQLSEVKEQLSETRKELDQTNKAKDQQIASLEETVGKLHEAVTEMEERNAENFSKHSKELQTIAPSDKDKASETCVFTRVSAAIPEEPVPNRFQLRATKEVLLNQGGGWSTDDGCFVVSLPGVYLFVLWCMMAVDAPEGSDIELGLKRQIRGVWEEAWMAVTRVSNAGGKACEVCVRQMEHGSKVVMTIAGGTKGARLKSCLLTAYRLGPGDLSDSDDSGPS